MKGKYYGTSNDIPNPNDSGENGDGEEAERQRLAGTLRNRTPRWVSGGVGGMVGALSTFLLLVLPVVQIWLANAKEVSLAQIKNSADQIAYITKRMQDSDNERDIYKSEMLQCQKELRELKK